jgi:predicted DNA binding CopG/RHH family protein
MSDKENLFANASKALEQSRVPALKERNASLFEDTLTSFTARLPNDLVRRLKVLAAEEGTSMQVLAAEAVTLLLKGRKKL